MKKILFVTSRNILTTCGELRLIKNRAESIYDEYHIVTDFLVWQKKERINSKEKEIISSGGEIETVEFSLSKLLKGYKQLKKLVFEKLETKEYGLIVLSGVSTFAKDIKKEYRVKIALDVHGSTEDLLELARSAPLKRKMKYFVFYLAGYTLLRINARYFDMCFVVTQKLKEYVINRYKLSKDALFFVAPCSTEISKMTTEAYNDYRSTYRKKYGINDNEIVFVYSGGISAWQCLKETIDLYHKIHEQIPNSRFLIFSHNIEAIRELANDESISFDSFQPAELEKALCAGDFAFMIRKDCVTNNVAFPNKYLEYVKSGMKIISTPYLCEIAEQIKEFDIGFLYDFEEDISSLVKYVMNHSLTPFNVEKINSIINYNGFNNRLRGISEVVGE